MNESETTAKHKGSEPLKYVVLNTASMGADSVFFGFVAMLLLSKGFSGVQIGTLLSFAPIILALSMPILGRFDRGKSRRILLVACIFILVVAEITLVYTTAFATAVAVIAVASVVRAPRLPSVESMTTLYCMEKGGEFSFYRGFGSIGFLVAVFVGGFLYESHGVTPLLIISCVLWGISALAIICLKPLEIDILPREKEKENDFKVLFKNKAFVLFVFFQAILYGAMLFNTNFEMLYLEERGFKTSLFSWLTLLRVGVEVIVFFVLRKKTLPLRFLILSAPLIILIQSVIFFTALPLYSLFIANFFSGVAWGIMIYVNNRYLRENICKKSFTMAVYISMTVQHIALAVLLLSGGVFMDYLSIKHAYLATGAIFVLCFVYALFAFGKQRRTQNAE
ncbi:MAG: MFS transporter [Firmicutes bacterium]|nr:MFS transporter [Bacillota bacterium]